MDILKYKHLINPFYSLTHTGEGKGDAPSGKFALSDNKKLNMATWNLLVSGTTAAAATALVTKMAQIYWRNKLAKKLRENAISKTTALRPAFRPDADLKYIDDVVKGPQIETKMLEEIEKTASVEPTSDSRGFLQRGVDWLAEQGIGGALPPLAVGASIYATSRLMHHIEKKALEKKLLRERIAIRNYQAAVDHELLREQGLLKSASIASATAALKKILVNAYRRARVLKRTAPKAASKAVDWVKNNPKKSIAAGVGGTGLAVTPMLIPSKEERAARELLKENEKVRESVISTFFAGVPASVLTTAAVAAGLAGLHLANKQDTDRQKTDYLFKKVLGANNMQLTPSISLSDLPVEMSEVVARPGDKNPVVITDKPDTPTKLLEDKVQMLEEVIPEIVEEKAKDAIF